MKKFFIHVGFRKTATTYLQKQFFPYIIDENHYYIKPGDKIYNIVRSLLHRKDDNLDLKSIKDDIDVILKDINQDNIILSIEALIGESNRDFYNHEFIRDTLKYLFDDISIIITIRKQDEILRSLYMQTVHIGSSSTFNEFSNFSNNSFNDYREYDKAIIKDTNMDIKSLDYYKFYKSYTSVCDEKDILVLPFEMMISDKCEFYDKLCAFINLNPNDYQSIINSKSKSKNRSYSKASLAIAIFFNKLFPKKRKAKSKNKFQIIISRFFKKYFNLRFFLQNILDNLFYVKATVMTKEQSDMIMQIHKNSNKQLSDKLNLNLDKLGYY